MEDEIVKKKILKTISIKTNNNQKNMNQIWQMKKSGEWNWKKIPILYINSNKTNNKKIRMKYEGKINWRVDLKI
jgi:hypothetical protein